MTTKPPTPLERMTTGYASRDYDQQRKEKLAAIFRPNDRMERLIEMRAKDPAILDRFDSSTRIELGLYQQQRDAANYEPEGDDAA